MDQLCLICIPPIITINGPKRKPEEYVIGWLLLCMYTHFLNVWVYEGNCKPYFMFVALLKGIC